MKAFFVCFLQVIFIKGHASQAFLGRPLKNLFSGNSLLSGRAISPSYAFHVAASTLRADMDINVPDGFQNVCHGKAGIFFPETLMPLERKDQFQVSGFVPVVQETIVPDFLKTGRKYMHQVTADKFRILKCDFPARSTGGFPSCRERNLPLIHRQNPAVGYGNLMGIPSKVFDGIAKAVEGFFYVRAPILFVKGIPEGSPFIRIPQFFTGGGKSQLPFLEEALEAGKKFPLKFIPEDFHPEKEIFLYFADLMIGGKSSAGNNTMHMHMIIDLLVPGMEYLDDTGCCAEVLFAFGKS